MSLPTDAQERKETPIFSGVLRYFPDALAEVARVSKKGNDQHNPGQPLHWAKEKSTDEADALTRHLLQTGTFDSDGMRHSAKVAWRALALLQREIEAEQDNNKENHEKNISHANTARQGIQDDNRQKPVQDSEKVTIFGWGRRLCNSSQRPRAARYV